MHSLRTYAGEDGRDYTAEKSRPANALAAAAEHAGGRFDGLEETILDRR